MGMNPPSKSETTKIKSDNEGNWEACSIEVYKWNGSIFSYDIDSSKMFLDSECEF
ncbi:MAG: hypothetical protein ACP5K4_10580 [Caldisericum sp.]